MRSNFLPMIETILHAAWTLSILLIAFPLWFSVISVPLSGDFTASRVDFRPRPRPRPRMSPNHALGSRGRGRERGRGRDLVAAPPLWDLRGLCVKGWAWESVAVGAWLRLRRSGFSVVLIFLPMNCQSGSWAGTENAATVLARFHVDSRLL